MPRDPIPTWFFALVVVRQGDRFLLVHERKFNQPWYLPAGRVEPGETLTEAALRETLEEAGIPVILDGILRIEHSPRPEGTARLRVIFVGHPAADVPPKSTPDEESLGAAWFSLHELDDIPLRISEVPEILRYVRDGGLVHPLDLIDREGWRYGSFTWAKGSQSCRHPNCCLAASFASALPTTLNSTAAHGRTPGNMRAGSSPRSPRPPCPCSSKSSSTWRPSRCLGAAIPGAPTKRGPP